jgi:outer membrane protein assembly factor BamB
MSDDPYTFPIPPFPHFAAGFHSMNRFVLALGVLFIACAVRAADWPQFRGPNSDGNYTGPKLPTEWGTDKNVVWKTPIPGHGWSSPIIWKGKVYLTTAVPKPEGFSLQALCIDAPKGTILWTTEVFIEDTKTAPKVHNKNSHASPTPLTDGERLYVHFGHMGTAALTLDGKIVWKNDKNKYKPVHGNGGSPILAGDNLVFSIDGGDMQAVLALNKKTGNQAWKTDRKSTATQPFSFSTPLLIKQGGKELIISPASGFVAAYDAKTGAETWRFRYPVPGYSVIPQPVQGNGMVYVSTSYNNPVVLAIKPNGSGDITSSNLAWSAQKGGPHTPSMLVIGENLFMVTDKGFAAFLDAKTGEVHWSEQRLGGGFSASPIHHDGKIYLTNETGQGWVLAASKEFKEISKSDLKERTFATFAAVDGALYIRTETTLYRFGEKK